MNISKLDLNLLVVFDALMHERNVTRAAHRLFLSQPAVSHALARLRTAIDDPLFVRNGRDMTPTPRAEALIPLVRPLLEGLNEALHGTSFNPATLEHTFRLALPDVAEFVVVPPLLPALRKAAPRVKLTLQDLDLDQFQTQLATGELDAAIIADVPLRPGMHKRLVAREANVVGLVHKRHAALRGALTAKRLRSMQRLAITLSGGRLVSPIEHSPLAREMFGEVMVSTPHFAATAATLNHSDLILIIGELAGDTLARLFDLRVIKLPFKLPPVESVLVWHERTNRDPAQRWFRDCVSDSLAPVVARYAPKAVSRPTHQTTAARDSATRKARR